MIIILMVASLYLLSLLGNNPSTACSRKCFSSHPMPCLRPIDISSRSTCKVISSLRAPSFYVLNAASLAKPHAFSHLKADIYSLNPDAVVISETFLSSKHSDSLFHIDGFITFRKDRPKHKLSLIHISEPTRPY